MVPRELCTRKVTIEDRSYMAHPRACFFCKHLENVVWDYTHGPYMFFCEKYREDPDGEYTERGLKGECPDFQEEES